MELAEITKDNWRQAVFLTTDAEGKNPLDQEWIACNAFSLLQMHYDPDWDCRLIMEEDKAVGFVFYGYWREREKYLLCRFMIDRKYQGKGYGKRALPLAVEQIRRQYGCREVWLTVDDENERAVKLYTRFGFRRTDMMDEKERIYILEG